MFVNFTTKSAQHAHAWMIAIIVEKLQNNLQNGCLHDVRDASLACELSQFLTAWRLVLSMKPWSYIWLEFGLFSTIIYIYIYIYIERENRWTGEYSEQVGWSRHNLMFQTRHVFWKFSKWSSANWCVHHHFYVLMFLISRNSIIP